jgi:hypothetical protein
LFGSDSELMRRTLGGRGGKGAGAIKPFTCDKVFSAGDEGHGKILFSKLALKRQGIPGRIMLGKPVYFLYAGYQPICIYQRLNRRGTP